MFSPSNGATANGPTLRASRRRARPASNENLQAQPKAKRQRASLNDNTFADPNGVPETQTTRARKPSTTIARRESNASILPKRELSLRGKKSKPSERVGKGDASSILSKNDTYTVSRLPALPDRLQAAGIGRHHGAIYSDRGYGLTLTATHALVWPYALNTTTPETFTFTLPYPSKHPGDPLPLGSLVSPSAASTEPGLVVVMPTTGKITYWESISSAATLDLIQQARHGVEHTIAGMWAGETVVQILNAETAGFVLSFSSGRTAYMSVRDGHGRPSVNAQFLKGAVSQASGIFGSFKSVFSHSTKGEFATARAGPLVGPGERGIVTATKKGKLQAWNLHREGANTFEADAETREEIVDELKRTNTGLMHYDIDTFELLDLAFVPPTADRSHSAALTYRDEHGTELLLLTAMTRQDTSHYALVQLFLSSKTGATVGNIRHINSYFTPPAKDAVSRPKLYLPNPGTVAFLTFQRAVVIASMANEPDSAEAQLLAESHGLQTFEDVIDFRKDSGVEITGSGYEEPASSVKRPEDFRIKRNKFKHPAVVLLVKNGGLIRVSINDANQFVSAKPPKVTAKSKLEQAVFFGNLENNVLSFSGRSEIHFSPKEYGDAAKAISQQILTSSTLFLPAAPASIRYNLTVRSEALQTLARQLKLLKVNLDRATRWDLLHDAEKLASAAAAWEVYDNSLATQTDPDNVLWKHLVVIINENHKTQTNTAVGEVDRIRHFFIHDINRFNFAAPYAVQVVKELKDAGILTPAQFTSLLSEANDLHIAVLETAYKFRSAHLEAYGLSNETLIDGALERGQNGLPEPWTCEDVTAVAVMNEFVMSAIYIQEAVSKAESAALPVTEKIMNDLPKLAELALQSNAEKVSWYLGQDEESLHETGRTLQDKFCSFVLVNILHYLAKDEIGLADVAIALAEKHRDLITLARLILDPIWKFEKDIALLETQMKGAVPPEGFAEHLAELQEVLGEFEGRNDSYFDKFGAHWADASYNYYMKMHHHYDLIKETANEKRQSYITNFLRSRREYAKIAWINEVKNEQNYDRAATDLIEQAKLRERNLWSKKVELSIGKLAHLSKGYSQANGLIVPDGGAADLKGVDDELKLISIQEKIFNHVRPVAIKAIDLDAALTEVLAVFENPNLKKKPALSMWLRERMDWLLQRQAMDATALIDLLTLLGTRKESEEYEEPTELDGEEFFYALQALNLANLDDGKQFKLTAKLIWRRCLLRDDWAKLNKTDNLADEQVNAMHKRTALYMTLKACYKNGLITSTSAIQPMKPKEIYHSVFTENDSPFRTLDSSIRGALLSDMKAEDAPLKDWIAKHQLQKWFDNALATAKRDVEEEKKAEKLKQKETAAVARQMDDLEVRLRDEEREKAQGMLKSKQTYAKRERRRERGVASLVGQSSFNSSVGGSFQASLRR